MHSAYQIQVTAFYSGRIDIDKKSLYFFALE
ncbi:hypothetical protein LMG22037_00878 [Paraburkholderia phenoliruptrix]|uniref:Uncharacterized protein n=1 Tax=Paraburkholderia phenoliruptrix TaxID=252970 RepID=A0A6J5A5T4_9BURK|nr:hypothetical protein LMG22037_00878 [Paraburkholderia phenoliruptrix]